MNSEFQDSSELKLGTYTHVSGMQILRAANHKIVASEEGKVVSRPLAAQSEAAPVSAEIHAFDGVFVISRNVVLVAKTARDGPAALAAARFGRRAAALP